MMKEAAVEESKRTVLMVTPEPRLMVVWLLAVELKVAVRFPAEPGVILEDQLEAVAQRALVEPFHFPEPAVEATRGVIWERYVGRFPM